MNKFEVRFRDVQINGDVRSWKAKLKDFNASVLIKHLAARGLQLNCYGTTRFPDHVVAEEWDGDELHGRILRGGTDQIGTFVVRELTTDELVDDAVCHTSVSQAEPLSLVVSGAGYPHEVPASLAIPF